MSYRIEADETVPEAVPRIAREQIGKARDEIASCEPRKAVHQVRKRCKKLRGLLRLVRLEMRDVYDRENAHFRDAARALSELRDATSLLECFDGLMEGDDGELDPQAGGRIRAALEERREKVEASQGMGARLEKTDAALAEAARRVEDWRPQARGKRAFARSAEKTYARAAKALRHAREAPSGENLHEWRKRVKYHRYHLRLLAGVWEPVAPALCEVAGTLSWRLGDHHDLVLLRATLLAERDRFGPPEVLEPFLALTDARRLALRSRAMPLGDRLFADPPRRWRRRWKRYWSAWQAEIALPAASPRPGR